jgi:hypothetical protein
MSINFSDGGAEDVGGVADVGDFGRLGSKPAWCILRSGVARRSFLKASSEDGVFMIVFGMWV